MLNAQNKQKQTSMCNFNNSKQEYMIVFQSIKNFYDYD